MYAAQVKYPKNHEWLTVASSGDHKKAVRDASLERLMLDAGFRYSEMHGHREDLVAGHVLTADNGTAFRLVEIAEEAPASDRTDHSAAITEMRDAADAFEKLHKMFEHVPHMDTAVSLRAAADLLEIHDATGLNLHQAPNLLAFVQRMAPKGTVIEDNGC